MGLYFLFFKKDDAFPQCNKKLIIKYVIIIFLMQLTMYATSRHNIASISMNWESALPILILVVLVPFYEEVIYRGCLFGFLHSIFKGDIFFPYVISSAVFCLLHTDSRTIGTYFFLFCVAIIFTHVRVKSNSIIYSFILHSSMNASFVLLNMQRFF